MTKSGVSPHRVIKDSIDVVGFSNRVIKDSIYVVGFSNRVIKDSIYVVGFSPTIQDQDTHSGATTQRSINSLHCYTVRSGCQISNLK